MNFWPFRHYHTAPENGHWQRHYKWWKLQKCGNMYFYKQKKNLNSMVKWTRLYRLPWCSLPTATLLCVCVCVLKCVVSKLSIKFHCSGDDLCQWFCKHFWQIIINYTGVILDISMLMLMYVWYRQRFGNWLFFQVQVIFDVYYADILWSVFVL